MLPTYIRCALVTPFVCQMIPQMGYDGEWASEGLQPVAEVEAAPDPAPVAVEVLSSLDHLLAL